MCEIYNISTELLSQPLTCSGYELSQRLTEPLSGYIYVVYLKVQPTGVRIPPWPF